MILLWPYGIVVITSVCLTEDRGSIPRKVAINKVMEELVPVKEYSSVPITEIFGIKFSEQLDIATFLWVGAILVLLYTVKGCIDFVFAYLLKKTKE